MAKKPKRTIFIKGESNLTKKVEEKSKAEVAESIDKLNRVKETTKPTAPVKEAKAKKLITWPQTFAKVMVMEEPATRKEIIGKMLKVREGATEKQAEAWTTEYLALLTTMGYCDKKDGKYKLRIHPVNEPSPFKTK